MTADAGIDAHAELAIAIGNLTAQLQRQDRDRQRWAQVIRQIPLTAPLLTASGVLDSPDTLKAKTGYNWSIRRLALTGWSAGSVTVTLNDANGETLALFATPDVRTYPQGAMLLHDDDRIVITGTGITGTVRIAGAADCFESWYLPYYLD